MGVAFTLGTGNNQQQPRSCVAMRCRAGKNVVSLAVWKRSHRAPSRSKAPEGFLAAISARRSSVTPESSGTTETIALQCSEGMRRRARHELTVDSAKPSTDAAREVPPSAVITVSTDATIPNLILRRTRSRQVLAQCEGTENAFDVPISGMGTPQTEQARRLIATRIALGFETPSEFARAMKMSQGHLSDFESGKRNISLGFALKLKKRFGVPIDWTICGDAQFLAPNLAKKIDLAA